jgi:predicted RNA-binding Zn ribbon-like protein
VSAPHPEPFKLYAGHPAIELVNTLDMRHSAHPMELIPGYGDLLRFTAQLGLLTSDQAHSLAQTVSESDSRRVLSSTIALREALASVLYGRLEGAKAPDSQLKVLEAHFHDAGLRRRLREEDGFYVWSWSGVEHDPALPLWKLAQEAADLLLSSDVTRISACGDPTCRWLFLDTSKNHTRRWCDMKTCGNRMKARRYQARAQQNHT